MPRLRAQIVRVLAAEQKQFGILRRALQHPIVRAKRSPPPGRAAFQDQMRIDAAESHRADAGAQRRVRRPWLGLAQDAQSEEHTSELQSQSNLVCRLLLEKKKKK